MPDVLSHDDRLTAAAGQSTVESLKRLQRVDDREDIMDQPKRLLRQELEALRRAGVRYLNVPAREAKQAPQPEPLPSAPRKAQPPSAQRSQPTARSAKPRELVLPDVGSAAPRSKVKPVLSSAEGWSAEKLTTEQKLAQLRALEERVRACLRCPVLVNSRTQTVFGVGNPDARLCFVGEAPGADEDRLGEPFVGRAGQLLNKMIEAMGLTRSDVYICNVLKCRPPQNRTPELSEVRNCAEFLDEQLNIIQPEMICALGSVAAKRLLGTTASLSKARGRVFRYLGAKVVVTYHPAYLLRNPNAKRDAWQDLQLVLREMGLPVPQPRRRS